MLRLLLLGVSGARVTNSIHKEFFSGRVAMRKKGFAEENEGRKRKQH